MFKWLPSWCSWFGHHWNIVDCKLVCATCNHIESVCRYTHGHDDILHRYKHQLDVLQERMTKLEKRLGPGGGDINGRQYSPAAVDPPVYVGKYDYQLKNPAIARQFNGRNQKELEGWLKLYGVVFTRRATGFVLCVDDLQLQAIGGDWIIRIGSDWDVWGDAEFNATFMKG